MNKKKSDSTTNKKRRAPTVKGLFTFFIVFFLANLFVGIVLAAASGGDSWKSMLFHNGSSTDLFMDFFNSIRDGGSPDVYTQRNNIYPPLCILIFRFFSKLISPELVSSYFSRRTTLQSDQLCMMIYIVFAIVCILSLFRMVESYINIKNDGKFKTYATVTAFLVIISYPVMFCLERGNILILSMICSMFFIFFRNSENKTVKELSYILLAVAAGIKLYPAVFGLILVIERKYKDALRLMAYGVAIVVFPIVFFLDEFKSSPALINTYMSQLLSISSITTADGNSSAIMKILNNLSNFALYKKNSLNFSSVSIQNIFFMIGAGSFSAKIACIITEFIAFIAAFYTKREWQKVFLLTYLMLNIPSASNSYALSFMVIPFCVFLFGSKKFRAIDRIVTAAFALLLTPLPTFWYYHPEPIKKLSETLGLYYNSLLNQDIATVVFQFLFVLTVFDILFCAKRLKKNKKKSKKDDDKLSGMSIAKEKIIS